MQTDNFITVSPGGNTFYTADPQVISQITTRRNDFPKPVNIYRSVDLFGKNVVSTEGQAWRKHRKLVSPPFTEKNNHLVWSETLKQTQDMLALWVGSKGNGDVTIHRLMDDTMRLSLHVISRAGFGQRMEWPKEEDLTTNHGLDDPQDPSKIQNEKAPGGHLMSYTFALHCLLKNIILVMLAPTWLLKNSPFAKMRKAHEAHMEWGRYMQEMAADKKAAIKSGESETGDMDLMGQIVKGQNVGSNEKTRKNEDILTDAEVLGNAFVFILAGHETAANSIHFSIIFMALNYAIQQQLQQDLNAIFTDKPISEWDYDRDLPQLFGGVTGAVLNEELRLVMPVVTIPKCTLAEPQPLHMDGRSVTVPAKCSIGLCTASVHRNPKYWPHGPESDPELPANVENRPGNDLEEFKVDRWLLTGEKKTAAMPGDSSKTLETEELGINVAADTSNSLYKPEKGAFIPFSEGFRACIGRRFAQVEVLAALAVIFREYTAELAVDEWASDEEVDRMDLAQKKEVWDKAAKRAKWLMKHGMGSVITLQMRKGHVPVRFVRRGNERFKHCV
ncbi:MAG: hypothetical protein Q9227_003097 [Pyrenula ochraceoflavens]